MASCLVCGTAIEPFIEFGRMPIANGFLTEEQFAIEPYFDLAAAFCGNCRMVQLTELVDPHRMFHENYAFYSSLSTRMVAHFQRFAADVQAKYLGSDPLVVEIGSNDGILLQHFAKKGVRHLGVEPSANVADVARSKGINTECAFFDESLAARILGLYGKVDAFLGANVMCHIPAIHSVIAGIKLLLKSSGVMIFEDPYLGDIIEKTSYDQIYDEHAFYFSVTSLDYIFEQHELEIVDIAPQHTHGGSMRYVVGHRGVRAVSAAVSMQRSKERVLKLDEFGTYQQFHRRVNKSRDDLMSLLRRIKSEGKRVVGYGATSKSTTVTNYCGITPGLVEFISDTTPIKKGKFSPGMHIPVKPHEDFAACYPDYALLFAWNHGDEIRANETGFSAAGGKWISYVPEVAIQP